MRLQLKPSFISKPDTKGGTMLFARHNEGVGDHYVYFGQSYVRAYPHGGGDAKEFHTIEEAHAYLISQGSDSPWQEVPTAEELTAAAEGEGPSIDADATEVYRERRERLKNIVVDSGPRVRCIWRPSAAPRLCAVDRLEAAGYKLIALGTMPTFTNDTRTRVNVDRFANQYKASTVGAIVVHGDPLPGLNAALESLLSKPVGAVTVAQILGVSP